MALLLPVGNPLSNGYDFIGKPNHRFCDEPPVDLVEEEPEVEIEPEVQVESEVQSEPEVVEPEVVEEPKEEPEVQEEVEVKEEAPEPVVELKTEVLEEKPVIPEVKPIVKKPEVKEEPKVVLPEPEEYIEPKKSVDYIELDYSDFDVNNPKALLPTSDSGNYIIIYRSDSCPYCDKLVDELKGKIEAYIVIVIRCKYYYARDLFYNRTISSFPSWVIITKNRVTYYGNGFYPLGSFKRML